MSTSLEEKPVNKYVSLLKIRVQYAQAFIKNILWVGHKLPIELESAGGWIGIGLEAKI
ncbi:MAG: hypothetical protein F6K31_36415 [Symploca sp. SIO2G7]|nr:hypothetical protein [Symploca sp. SIO2G7]